MATHGLAHLHVHTEYSLFDGAIRIKELVRCLKERGHSHVAITDHGNMHGAIELYQAAKSADLIPIVGAEIYVAAEKDRGEDRALAEELGASAETLDAFHLLLLARDTVGYKSLMKVVSAGYLGDALGQIAHTPADSLREHNGQLIALSSCLRGEFGFWVEKLREQRGSNTPLFVADSDELSTRIVDVITRHVAFMHECYGVGNYYVELIDNGLPRQKRALPDLVEAARHFGLPIVASADAHYLDEDFAKTHTLALAIKNGIAMKELRERRRDTRFHLLSDEEMRTLYGAWPEALENTAKIAEACSGLDIEMGRYYLPKIDLGTSEEPADALKRLAKEGLDERLRVLKPQYGPTFDEAAEKVYWDRLQHECTVILEMGFPDYFLIVQDFINWAKEHGIPVGPGRGSGAGSLVAYALRITDIDPIPYNLIFERFLNPERVSMPDFDVDFCQWRREEVIDYCIDKYGASNVAQITTFGKMQAKAAVKSVGRALGMGYTRIDQFTKLFPPDLGITLTDALEQEPRLKEEMAKDEELAECMEYALQLEGLASHTSVHAAGVVIADGAMSDYVPVYTTDGAGLITQYEMKPTEKVGLVKFDFLGLKTLTVIDKAVALVRARKNPDLDIADIPLDDASVYKMLSQGHTVGVFQCESGGMTQLITKLKPSTFEDIIALVALFRPGPLGSGMVDDFVERKHGRQKIEYPHPSLAPILKDTYGMILYQEQVQKIAAILASYSLGEADLLRRAMGKKIPEEMAKQKTRFVTGAVEAKIDQQLAEDIFELMAEFAKYGFNKSHSAAYGLVSYQTAYLKAHYPEEFLAASMTCDMDNTDKVVRYIEDCRRLGFRILPPDINRSGLEFDVPADGEIGFALSAIKGVGGAVLEALVKEREERGPYASLCALAERLDLGKLGKKTLELLCASGALDGFGYARPDLARYIPEVVGYSASLATAKAEGQGELFGGAFDELQEETAAASAQKGAPWEGSLIPTTRPREMEDLLQEKKLLGFFLSGHPLEFYKSDVRQLGGRTLATLWDGVPPADPKPGRKKKGRPSTVACLVTGVQLRRTKSGRLMAYVRLEEPGFSFEAMMFSQALDLGPLPPENTAVLAVGHAERDEAGAPRFAIDRLLPLEEVRTERVAGLSITLPPLADADTVAERLSKVLRAAEGDCAVRFVVNTGAAQAFVKTPLRVELRDEVILGIIRGSGGEAELAYHFREQSHP